MQADRLAPPAAHSKLQSFQAVQPMHALAANRPTLRRSITMIRS
jgi:hypothetical protein